MISSYVWSTFFCSRSFFLLAPFPPLEILFLPKAFDDFHAFCVCNPLSLNPSSKKNWETYCLKLFKISWVSSNSTNHIPMYIPLLIVLNSQNIFLKNDVLISTFQHMIHRKVYCKCVSSWLLFVCLASSNTSPFLFWIH